MFLLLETINQSSQRISTSRRQTWICYGDLTRSICENRFINLCSLVLPHTWCLDLKDMVQASKKRKGSVERERMLDAQHEQEHKEDRWKAACFCCLWPQEYEHFAELQQPFTVELKTHIWPRKRKSWKGWNNYRNSSCYVINPSVTHFHSPYLLGISFLIQV